MKSDSGRQKRKTAPADLLRCPRAPERGHALHRHGLLRVEPTLSLRSPISISGTSPENILGEARVDEPERHAVDW
jgi:hypothetical protein